MSKQDHPFYDPATDRVLAPSERPIESRVDPELAELRQRLDLVEQRASEREQRLTRIEGDVSTLKRARPS